METIASAERGSSQGSFAIMLVLCISLMLVMLQSAQPAPTEPSVSQQPTPGKISAAKLLADAEILRRAYETLHPGLLRYNTPAQVDANFAALDRALANDASITEAYLAFARFTATVRCGHSYPNFYNQSRALAARLFSGANRLPLHFVWLDGRMIVTQNLSGNDALRAGVEVTKIDGRAVSNILAALLPYARADGSNDAKRVDELQVTGTERYEAFDIYFPLLYPKAAETFSLTVRSGDTGSERRITVNAQTDADRAAAFAANSGGQGSSADSPLWTFTRPRPNVAYLRMPTWVTYNSKWNWQQFLDDVFVQLAADPVPRLIIDLRGNEGGTNVGDAIIAHLIDRPLVPPAVEQRVRYRAVPADIAPYLDTWDPSFKDWGDAAQPIDDRFFRLVRPDDDADAPIQPRAPRYHGGIFVLVDAANSSATFQFDQVVQQNHLARLAGTPTGGSQRGINGGAFFFVRLPNSGIEVDLPLIGTFPRFPAPDAGLTPDLLLEPNQADIAMGRDTILESVLARIAEEIRRQSVHIAR